MGKDAGAKGGGSSESDSPNSFHGTVKGRVQGVGYRVFAREMAQKYGVTGWVRNQPDGTVAIYAEADELVLVEFLTELYRGPIMSHVTDIVLKWGRCENASPSFEILR